MISPGQEFWDLKQWHELTAGGEPVLHQGVMAELEQLLNTDSFSRGEHTGSTQHFDDGPDPERVVLFAGQISAFAGGRILGPDLVDRTARDDRTGQGAAPATVSDSGS